VLRLYIIDVPLSWIFPVLKYARPFFLYLVCEAIGTAATPGLLCQPRVIVKMIVEKQMECRLAGGTEVLGENLPRGHFCPSQNPTWPDPGLNPGRRGGKPATNRLSYGAAMQGHAVQVHLAVRIQFCSSRVLTRMGINGTVNLRYIAGRILLRYGYIFLLQVRDFNLNIVPSLVTLAMYFFNNS
jgi:hypothetical protein